MISRFFYTKLLLFVFCLCIFIPGGLGQQLSNITQYQNGLSLFNPASISPNYIFQDYNINVKASHRNQLGNSKLAPTTQILSAEYISELVNNSNLIIAGHFIKDAFGPEQFSRMNLRLGLMIQTSKHSGLVGAFNFQASTFRLNKSKINSFDPLLENCECTKLIPDIGLGIYGFRYLGSYNQDLIYGGLSFPNVLSHNASFESNDSTTIYNSRYRSIYSTLGARKYLNGVQFLQASLLVRYAQGQPINVRSNFRIGIIDPLIIGIGYTTSKIFHTDITLFMRNKALQIGYGVDWSNLTRVQSLGTVHEFNIGYSIDR